MGNEITRKDLNKTEKTLRAETKELGVSLRSEIKEMTNEILEAINVFSTSIDGRFTKIESQMVTRDYLDRKLWEVRGDMHNMMKDHVAEMH